MTHATCPTCGALYCPVIDGRVWCPECERRKRLARSVNLGATCQAVRFVFRTTVDDVMGGTDWRRNGERR